MDRDDSQLELDKLFFRADNDIKDGNIVDAFDTLNYIIEQDIEYGKAYNHLGWIYETKYKNYNKAEECYRLALKYAPGYIPVYLNYSIVLSTLEKFDILEKLLAQALKIEGIDKSKIWNEYGIMYEMQEKYSDAIQAFKNAIKLSLNNQEIESYEQSIDRSKKKQRLNEMD